AVRDFEDNPDNKLLLLSLRAGGVGLNLTAASYVFHFDHWWNPAVEAQAEDRAHLIGQVRPVQIYSYLCANTVEERVASILAHKRKMFSDVVEGVFAARATSARASGADGGGDQHLTAHPTCRK